MKKIIDNRLYDTEKAKKIVEYREKVPHKGLITLYPYHHMTLYKTKKGTYFKHIGKPIEDGWNDDKEDLVIMSDEKVKHLLSEELKKADLYQELFGEVEEG